MLEPEASVEVAYALPDRQRVVRVPLREGMTALDAVRAAALEREFPELGRPGLALGIYGRRVGVAQPLRDGDRVEVYRPLKFDPREARRQAARAARPPRRNRP